MIQRFETKPRMSRAVIHNHTVYLCGQVAKDASADISEQTRTTLEKIDDLLESVGSDKTKLLSVTIYVKTMADFQAMNAVWDAWVPEGLAPARACVEAAMARPELLVEMSVIAAVPQD
ncbi:RidA family protein [Motiliproteus sediminis]|uniref:RidA family protein n=1 Tax=Motiliproteus sediminis TaxID=1468178 RepID=UPI001AF01B3D|nr:RidA family protein [Motiliproteus sediminis]